MSSTFTGKKYSLISLWILVRSVGCRSFYQGFTREISHTPSLPNPKRTNRPCRSLLGPSGSEINKHSLLLQLLIAVGGVLQWTSSLH